MAQIFISYSKKDAARVTPLVASLEVAGYTVWWDKHIQGGERYSKKIEMELQEAPVAIVVWTADSIQSRWVNDEAELALQTGVLVPVCFDRVSSPMGFRQIQALEFSDWKGEAGEDCFEALLRTIKEHIEPEKGKDAAREPAQTDAKEVSIAVLPFVNNSSDPEQEYFSDGISEELINLISKIPQIRVMARTSSFQFKGEKSDIAKIGKILGVTHILEGSVRKSGNQVRITAQLSETSRRFNLWSEKYDRKLDDIFAIQDEISAAIVKSLKSIMVAAVEAPVAIRSDNIASYDEYLAGKQLLAKRTRASIEEAKLRFQNSINFDQDYLPSLIGLAESYMLSSDDPICYGKLPRKLALSMANNILEQISVKYADSEDLHASLALYHYLARDESLAQHHAEKAIALNPNCSKAYRALGLILKWKANPRALVVRAREKVLLLDPASPIDILNLLTELPPRRRFEESLALVAKIDALKDYSVIADWGRHTIAWHQGRIAECHAIFSNNEAMRNDPHWAVGLQHVMTLFEQGPRVEDLNRSSALKTYCLYGYRDHASRLYNRMAEIPDASLEHLPATTLALFHIQRDNIEDAWQAMRIFIDGVSNEWGAPYDLDEYCLGARLLWFIYQQMGEASAALEFHSKLKEVYATRLLDHDGVHAATHYLGACIANMEGDAETALNEMKYYTTQYKGPSLMIFSDPLLANLSAEPAFQAMKEKVMAQISAEKQKAIASGLLADY